MVDNETEFVIRWFRYDMDRDDIHSGKQSVKWFGETFCINFLFTLRQHEFTFLIIMWRVLQLIVGSGIFILWLSPRPKTLSQTYNDGLDKWLVGMVFEEFRKFVDIDIADYRKKMRIVGNCFVSRDIIEFRLWGTRKRVCEKRILSGGANRTASGVPD